VVLGPSNLCTGLCTCRKQAWLWAQGDIYRSRPDHLRVGVVQRSSSLRRSVLRSRQEYEVDVADDSVSRVFIIIIISCLYSVKS